MKYTIMGFLQGKLKELGLDTIDALILRYFVDFGESNSMKVIVNDNKVYYWVQYDAVIRELPILKMKKCSIQARFFKLRDAGVLTHYTKKEGGTYSFFGLGERYVELISENSGKKEDHKNQETPLREEPADDFKVEVPFAGEEVLEQLNSQPDPMEENLYPIKENPQGYQLKPITNNPSTKDPSSLNPPSPLGKKATGEEEQLISQVIEYLNSATGKSFRPNTKATVRSIKARRKEGFNLQDFKTVIDNMVYRWTDTRFQQYLAPSTLFSSKFETYLQGGKVKGYEGEEKERNLQGKGAFTTKRGNVAALKQGALKSQGQQREALDSSKETAEDLRFVLKEDM